MFMFHWIDYYQSLKEHRYVQIKLDEIYANKKSIVFTIEIIHIFIIPYRKNKKKMMISPRIELGW